MVAGFIVYIAVGVVSFVAGYALGYSDAKLEAEHERNMKRMDVILSRLRGRQKEALRIIRGGKR